MKKYKQLVVEELDNSGVFLQEFQSDFPITMEKIVFYYEDKVGVSNWDENSITLYDSPSVVDLDE